MALAYVQSAILFVGVIRSVTRTGVIHMTVDPPLHDPLFGESDEELASAFDVDRTELAFCAMRVYSVSLPEAKDRIDTDETKVRADCMRYNGH